MKIHGKVAIRCTDAQNRQRFFRRCIGCWEAGDIQLTDDINAATRFVGLSATNMMLYLTARHMKPEIVNIDETQA